MDILKRIKRQLFRGYFKVGAHIHVRHWRGHGIHSPFMYAIVRNVFMKSHIVGDNRVLYNELLTLRIGRKNATKIQNLFSYCKMENYTIIGSNHHPNTSGRNLCILLPSVSLSTIAIEAERSYENGNCLIIISAHSSAKRWKLALGMTELYPCVSVDRRVMMIYFFDPRLQRQHYRI